MNTTQGTEKRADQPKWLIGVMAVAMAVGIGLLNPALADDPGATWAGYVLGGFLALVLWLGLFVGRQALKRDGGSGSPWPSVAEFTTGALLTLAFGIAMVAAMGNAAAWAVGVILAIAIGGATRAAKKS